MKIKNDNDIKFKKEDIVGSERYFAHKDLVRALLKDDVEYSLTDVDNMIKKFLEGVYK